MQKEKKSIEQTKIDRAIFQFMINNKENLLKGKDLPTKIEDIHSMNSETCSVTSSFTKE